MPSRNEPTENGGNKRPTRRWLTLAALLLLSALAGVWVASAWIKPAMPAPVPSDHSHEPQASEQKHPQEPDLRPRASVRVAELQPLPPEFARGGSAGETPDAEDCLVVRCNVADGGGAGNVRIRGRAAPVSGDAPDGREFLAETDVAGLAIVGGLVGHKVRLEPADDQWYWEPVELSVTASGTVVIVVARARTIRLHAMYDDGLPVTYMGSFHSADMVSYSRTFALSELGTSVVPGIPVDEPLTCLVYAQARAGYERHLVVFTSAELASGTELQIIVPKAGNKRGNIRIEFDGDVNPSRSLILLEREGDTPTNDDLRGGMKRWDSPPLRPGTWRVTVTGKLAWRSEWVEVAGGQITTLRATLHATGSVRARLLDASGAPLKAGALRLSVGRYLAYRSGNPPVPGDESAALSDESGVATLHNLPPGQLDVEAEAWGCQPEKKIAVVQPGQVTDLGDLVLGPATGEITVQLTGMRPDLNYVIIIMQPGLGQVRGDLPVESTSSKVGELPLRSYRVGVTLARSGTIVAETVELTADQPAKLVQIDVSSVKP